MTVALLPVCLPPTPASAFGAHVTLPPLSAPHADRLLALQTTQGTGVGSPCAGSLLMPLCLMPTGPPQQQVTAGEDSK